MKKETAVALGLGAVGIIAIVSMAKAKPPSPEGYVCPYCNVPPFGTYEELVAHVQTEHPGERIPIDIEWD